MQNLTDPTFVGPWLIAAAVAAVAALACWYAASTLTRRHARDARAGEPGPEVADSDADANDAVPADVPSEEDRDVLVAAAERSHADAVDSHHRAVGLGTRSEEAAEFARAVEHDVDHAERRLALARREAAEAATRREAIEVRLESLRHRADQARQRRAELDAEAEAATARRDAARDAARELHADVAATTRAIDDARTAIAARKGERDGLESEAARLSDLRDDLTARLSSLQDDLSSLNGHLDELGDENERLTATIRDTDPAALRDEVARAHDDVARADAAVAQAERTRASLSAELGRVERERAELAQARADLARDVAAREDELADADAANDAVRDQIRPVVHEVASERQAIGGLRLEADRLRDLVAARRQEHASLRDELAAQEHRLDEARAEHAAVIESVAPVQADLDAVQRAVAADRVSLDATQEEIQRVLDRVAVGRKVAVTGPEVASAFASVHAALDGVVSTTSELAALLPADGGTVDAEDVRSRAATIVSVALANTAQQLASSRLDVERATESLSGLFGDPADAPDVGAQDAPSFAFDEDDEAFAAIPDESDALSELLLSEDAADDGDVVFAVVED